MWIKPLNSLENAERDPPFAPAHSVIERIAGKRGRNTANVRSFFYPLRYTSTGIRNLRIAPPGQEGWREAPGWLFNFQNNHPVCAFGAATPPVQEGQLAHQRFFSAGASGGDRCRNGLHVRSSVSLRSGGRAAPRFGAQIVGAYLSRQHFENLDESCLMVALPTDIARSGASAKRAFENVFKGMVRSGTTPSTISTAVSIVLPS